MKIVNTHVRIPSVIARMVSRRAKKNRRSANAEIVVLLEQALRSRP